MTTEQKKEETRKKFNEAYNAEIVRLAEFDLGTDSLMDFIFDFFYSEIEGRDRRFKELLNLWNPVDEYVRPLTSLGCSVSAKALELVKRVERLEEIIKAAQKVIDLSRCGTTRYVRYMDAMESYNKLKSKLPSGI